MFQLELLFSILTLSFAAQSYSSTSQFSILQSNQYPKPNFLSIAVTAFGAIGDGVKYDTVPIQKAIDACSAVVSKHRCQCHVIFPPGKYLTATVFLKSGVVLDIHRKATILGGPTLEDYPKEQSRWYVILAEDATDVGIIGGGEINGQGLQFVERFDEKKNVMVSWNHTGACLGDECRPRLVGFIRCRNIKVFDVRLIEPAYWCLHVVRSDKTEICDVTIYGNFNSPNNDGIDIEDSNNTVITRCNINTGDDAICPKSSNGPVYNLTARDCWIRTKSSAIKLGSASFYTFKNFLFDNITIVESHRGLALQIRDGGNVSDMTFSNINISTRYYHPSWWGRAEPIYVTTCPRDASSKAGSISNLLFVNITATSENGIFLSGSGGGVLSNLKFTNMNLTYKRWTKFPDGLVDYRPGCQELVKHQTAGFMMEHIDGLIVEDVVMKWSSDESMRWNNPLDFRPSTRQLLFRCLSSNGSLSEALFEMAKQGLQVKFKEYDTLLNECINQMAIREGQRVHAHMIKTHYQPTVYLRTRLIVFYIKCGLLGDARSVFDEMPQRNVVSWTAVISGYSQKGHISEAIHLFIQMLTSGTVPNEFTFATVLTSCTGAIGFHFGRQTHCLLVKSPFESHVYVGSSLLNMYAKAGKVNEARYVFENLPEKDVVSCTAIISGYAQQGLYEEALELFIKLQAERMCSNYVTYTSVLTALSGLAAVEQGRQLHAHIIRLELPFYAVLHNSLIDMYSKCGKFTYSRTIFNQMSERTVSSWNAMLVCYSKHGMGKEVVELFKMMREEDKIKPDGTTLLAVLSGCSHGGMENKGVEIFNDISSGKERVEISIEHCGCVVDLLSRSGQVERAFQFIKEMPFQPTAAILGSLLGACWAHLFVDIGEIVARQLLEIEPENAGTYVILSNMYASAGRWEDARRVRELINARALVKETGKSWIGTDFIHETEKDIAKT